MEDGVVRAVLAIPSASMTEMQNVRKGPLSEQGVDEGSQAIGRTRDNSWSSCP